MRAEVEQLLPLISKGEISEEAIEEIKNRIRITIKQNPSSGKELGQLIVLINNALKNQSRSLPINWLPVGSGFLGIGHKPGGKISYEGLKNAGVTAVLTLLKENEGARQIGDLLKKVGIDWLWFPFSASDPPKEKDKAGVLGLFGKLKGLLEQGGRIYVHCSAGIHRTGMVTYGLLRYLGKEKSEAMQALRALREVTEKQAGAERLTWGDQYVKP